MGKLTGLDSWKQKTCIYILLKKKFDCIISCHAEFLGVMPKLT